MTISTSSEATLTSKHEQFLATVSEIIGAEHVVSSPAELEIRARDTVPGRVLPLAFVYPGSAEEVAKIAKLTDEYHLSLWPHSSGRNWGWSNSPLKEHAVVMILERMNRILRVDEDLAYAVIEPGVSYESLNNYLKENKIKLWADCTGGPPKGSVLGNALDRGVGVTTHGEHFASICGLEVVLANGNVIHTGGYPDGKEGTRYVYKWGIGPYLEGLFSQANFGIVTKAGVWLMPEPEAYVMFGFTFGDESLIPPLMDTLRKLALDGVIPDKIRITNDFAVLTLVTQWINENLKGKKRISEEEMAQLEKKYQFGKWAFCSSIYGRKENVEASRKILERELKPYGRLVFIDDPKVRWIQKLLPRLLRLYNTNGRLMNVISDRIMKVSIPMLRTLPSLYGVYQGIPTEQIVRRAYFRAQKERPDKDVHVAKDNIGLIWFGPLVPLQGKLVSEVMQAHRDMFKAYDFDCYITILMLNARTVVPLMGIIYRKEDPAESERAAALYRELNADALKRGYQQFRCNRLGWGSIYNESQALLDINVKIKEVFDPHHTLAPGKYGVQ